MSKAEHRIGVTPILQRLGFHYLCKGFGTHKIDHPQYDKIIVRELYGWQEQPNAPGAYGACILVEFFNGNTRERYLEYSIRRIGAGGKDILKKIV